MGVMQLIMLQGGCFALGSCERWQVERELIGIQKEDERSSSVSKFSERSFGGRSFAVSFPKLPAPGESCRSNWCRDHS